MAKSRNRNNQGKDHPNDNEQITDAEILDNDEQVEEQLIEEELDQMANEELEQVETKSEDNQSTEAIPAPTTEPKKKSSNAVWYGVAAVLVAAAVGGIYYSNQSVDKTLTPGTVNQPSADANPIHEVPADTQGLESSDPPLSQDVVPAPSDDEAFSVEMGEEDSKARFTGGAASTTPAQAPATPQTPEASEAETGEASTADMIEHQQEAEATVETDAAEEATEPANADEAEVLMVENEEASVENGVQSPTDLPEPADELVVIEEVQEGVELVPTDELEGAEAIILPAQEEVVEPQPEPMAEPQAEAVAEPAIVNPELVAELEREYKAATDRQQQEIIRLQEELAGMKQHLQDTNSNAENLLLNDVSRLLRSAENELRFNGNVVNAVSILTVAQRIAAESKNKMFEGLVGAIGADIVALKSSEHATVEEMFRVVQQIANAIDVAPLNTPDYASHSNLMLPTPNALEASETTAPVEAAPAATVDPNAKWYDRTWAQTKNFASKAYDAVTNDLGELVRVEKLSDPNSGLLSAEQAGVMRNNLKMQLGFAQQALMSKQQGIWQSSLTTVEEAMHRYFRQDANETVRAQNLIADLKKASVQPTMPDISHSTRALAETYEQLRVQRSFQE
jgi:uncharacterized protein HemX